MLTGTKLFIVWLRMCFPIMGMNNYADIVANVIVQNDSSDCMHEFSPLLDVEDIPWFINTPRKWTD